MEQDELSATGEAEENILLAGERLNAAVFRRFTDGDLSSDELQTVYNRLREWSRISEQLLEMLTDQKDREP